MLLRRDVLEKITAGDVTLVFRRWKRPTVKTGGTLKTKVGVLAIDAVEQIDVGDIQPRHVKAAGYADKQVLLDELAAREGDVYKIAVRFAGEDPRIALRNETKISAEEMDAICGRLDRFDAASKHGPWTLVSLSTLDAQPRVSARVLSAELEMERLWFKGNVRKLKAMGLTISFSPGYELSPRGKAVLAELKSRTKATKATKQS